MTISETHYRALERMYAAAPINQLFKPIIAVAHETATIDMALRPEFNHTAGAVHGAVYFKLLDEAAFFAANSVEPDYFVLTTSFTTYITRPVSAGAVKAVGKVVNRNNTQIIAEAVVYNDQGVEIGRGNGVFVRSKILLAMTGGYRDTAPPAQSRSDDTLGSRIAALGLNESRSRRSA